MPLRLRSLLASLPFLLLPAPPMHAAQPLPPTITEESQVPPYELPQPLLSSANTPILSPSQWETLRRPELLRLFETHVYGKTPLGRPDALRFVVREEIPNARGNQATRLRVALLFDGTETGPQMELLVYLPNHVPGPVPVILGLNFDGNYTTTAEPDLPVPSHWAMGLFANKLEKHTPSPAGRGIHQHLWPYAYALEHGFGVATAAYGEIEPDADGFAPQGPRGLAPLPESGAWGRIGAWAWGLSRAMDYLETHPRVDAQRVVLTGFSRLGKAALWAGAQDPRFAMVASFGSGAGGAALSKRLFGETVQHLVARNAGWFTPSFTQYAANEAQLPVDQHELLALIAPRPLLVTSGSTDLWSDPRGEFLSALAASPVYQLLGHSGLPPTMPPASTLLESRIGYFLRPGAHDVTLEDWQALLRFAKKHLP
jgi:hypothetical protein